VICKLLPDYLCTLSQTHAYLYFSRTFSQAELKTDTTLQLDLSLSSASLTLVQFPQMSRRKINKKSRKVTKQQTQIFHTPHSHTLLHATVCLLFSD